jgi:hypothetical protein
LTILGKFLNMSIDQTRVDLAAEETRKTLESFGLIRSVTEEKKKEEQQLRWFV